MKREFLFVRFVNKETGVAEVIDEFLEFTEDTHSREVATKTRKNLPELSLFLRDFRNALADIIENGISQKFINYVNSYMKPSLTEFVEGSGTSRTGEERWVVLKEDDTPWVEALICYNLMLYIRTYGMKELKLCPVCQKFFTNKGKYAKYCSERCKAQGKA